MPRWIALACLVTTLCTWAHGREPPVQAQLLADVSGVQPGVSFTVGVLLELKPGWHVYWINPGDSGLTTSVQLAAPEGFAVGPVQYPVPQLFAQPGGITGYGYEDSVLLTATVTPPQHMAQGSEVVIGATASWLSCEQVCIPGKARLSLRLVASPEPATIGSAPPNQELFARWRQRLPVQAGECRDLAGAQAAAQVPGAGSIRLHWRNAPADATGVQWFPEANDPALVLKGIAVQTSGNETRITFVSEVLPGQRVQRKSLASVVAYSDEKGQRRGVLVEMPLSSPP